MDLTEALVTVKNARDHVEAVRDVLPEVRTQLDLEDEGDHNYLQRLFEAAFPDTVLGMSLQARHVVYDQAFTSGGPLMSVFNEYASYMDLATRVQESENTNFTRPSNPYATEVAEANNPIGAAYSILRKQKKLTDNQIVTILEAAFPLATNGLDEETRDHLYGLAAERGVTPVEVANAYGELVELITAVRFVEDED